jgi:hypothetical protein
MPLMHPFGMAFATHRITMKKRKHHPIRYWILAIGAVFAIAIGSGFYLKHQIRQALATKCGDCHIGSIQISILHPMITLSQARLRLHPPKGTSIELDLDQADIKFVLSSLLLPWKTPILPEVALTGVHVTLIDDDKTPGDPVDFRQRDSLSTLLRKLPAVRIDRIALKNSFFTYRQIAIGGAVGEIHVSEINGDVSSFGTRQPISPERVQVNLSALLEHSGRSKITADWDLYSEEDEGLMGIDVIELKIAELNPYFDPHDRVQLSGNLDHFHAKLTTAKDELTGEVLADYDSFKIHYVKTPKEGTLKTWFKNTVDSALMSSKRPRGPKDKPQAPISYRREKDDAFVHFLLQGIAPAIQHIASS